ncbi:DEAD/DEAH box helicase [Marinobacter sp.]|uniref:type I-G CRISPR-associated helicase/endonuclease Cas3g n=1 Tax=Marinobacter sp. TaxID=50741 RepID=UPI003A936A4E
MDITSLYRSTTGFDPYPYQAALATEEQWPEVLSVPTGVGKTAAVMLAWIWRRRFGSQAVRQVTPRRLVYCLPMRTLVEQTRDCAVRWLDNLGGFAGTVTYADDKKSKLTDFHVDLSSVNNGVSVHVLMGGEDGDSWDEHPERDAIIIGTQDMLLSRALNRGYGMSRYRWPMHFGLLNNDCLWVMDETQLMGVGLTTSCQMAAFRTQQKSFGISQTLWMSATLDSNALATVDHAKPDPERDGRTLATADTEHDRVAKLLNAKKPLTVATTQLNAATDKKGYDTALADEVLNQHAAGSLTLVVLNSVQRARDLFSAINRRTSKQDSSPEVELIHSRFRPTDRQAIQARSLDESTILETGPGRIIVATQAIEAGVDISARVLFTELAPWPSLVQRFGRCNRRGSYGTAGTAEAAAIWIDIDTTDTKKSALRLPYEWDSLDRARAELNSLTDVGPQSLSTVDVEEPRPLVHVLRRKDLIDLFDTTPDLSGNDLDISRYIRDAEDCDVQVYWRDWDLKATAKPPQPTRSGDERDAFFPAADRRELCSVPIARARDFIAKQKQKLAFCWEPLANDWFPVDKSNIRPGTTILLHQTAGGYERTLGWTGETKHAPDVIELDRPRAEAAMDSDDLKGHGAPVELTQHLRDVGRHATQLKETLADLDSSLPWQEVVTAAHWHDVGKGHVAFQTAMLDSDAIRQVDPDGQRLWAKSGESLMPRYRVPAARVSTHENAPSTSHEDDTKGVTSASPLPSNSILRRGFRHELASAIAWLEHHRVTGDSSSGATNKQFINLVAYLIAAHHGKVRLSIRSMPNEKRPPDPTIRFARGIWEGDQLPAVDLGNGQTSSPVEAISLEIMNIGQSETHGKSWLARMLEIRDHYGPFRLAYLETLLRIADWRGSRADCHGEGGAGAAPDPNI